MKILESYHSPTQLVETRPKAPNTGAILRLLQDVSSQSDELPCQLWIPSIGRHSLRDGGGEADIRVAIYRGRVVASREVRLKYRPQSDEILKASPLTAMINGIS